MKIQKSIQIVALLMIAFIIGCQYSRPPGDQYDENIRYMYFTCWPDNCRLALTIVFKDDTPMFHDERVTKEHEPIVYSVDARKVKTVTLKISKYGWIPQTMKWEGQVPHDVFIKLEERR